uniref:Ig-like domain-containing protein n=1 Tax=Meleagris gallopavo TaxID=9103 RepID=A0A803XSZ3_MELGA
TRRKFLNNCFNISGLREQKELLPLKLNPPSGKMLHGALPAVAVDQKEKQKPELVLVPEPARVLEGETARFRCRVTGYPIPKVNWYLNSQLIRKSKRFRLRYDGIHYLDIVDYVTSDDSASIMVKAVNIAGETSSHAFLLVQGNFKSLTFILLPIIAITLVKPI